MPLTDWLMMLGLSWICQVVFAGLRLSACGATIIFGLAGSSQLIEPITIGGRGLTLPGENRSGTFGRKIRAAADLG